MKDINDIAAKFLGKDAQTSYQVPEQIDSSLLVAIPRSLNRDAHDINPGLFNGFDTWNCYELSTINAKGRPFSGVMKIFFPADSTNIVESKSLKLYLNSFNLFRLSSTNNNDLKEEITEIVTNDLRKHIGDERIKVKIYNTNSKDLVHPPILHNQFENIDNLDIEIPLNNHQNSTKLFEIIDQQGILKIHSALLRSNCRVTNQPDWGDVYIYLKAYNLPTKESLLKYIVSMRKEQHFHEEICENIYSDLHNYFKPSELLVQCLYTRRGGIDINPIRHTENLSSNELLLEYFNNDSVYKTSRQ